MRSPLWVCVAAAATTTTTALVRTPTAPTARRLRIFARPDDCPERIWAQVVEAEEASRAKKFGTVGAGLAQFGLDKGAIEANQLRIWEELKRRADNGEAIPTKQKDPAAAAAESKPGFFGELKSAWDKVYKEADSQAYAQAVALSADLENKGMLPKVVTAEGSGYAGLSKKSSPKAAGKKGKKAKKSRGFG